MPGSGEGCSLDCSSAVVGVSSPTFTAFRFMPVMTGFFGLRVVPHFIGIQLFGLLLLQPNPGSLGCLSRAVGVACHRVECSFGGFFLQQCAFWVCFPPVTVPVLDSLIRCIQDCRLYFTFGDCVCLACHCAGLMFHLSLVVGH